MDKKYYDGLRNVISDISDAPVADGAKSTLMKATTSVVHAMKDAMDDEDALLGDLNNVEMVRTQLDAKRKAMNTRKQAQDKLNQTVPPAQATCLKAVKDYQSQHKPKEKQFQELSDAVTQAHKALEHPNGLDTPELRRIDKARVEFNKLPDPKGDRKKLMKQVETFRNTLADALTKDPSVVSEIKGLDQDAADLWKKEKAVASDVGALQKKFADVTIQWAKLEFTVEGINKIGGGAGDNWKVFMTHMKLCDGKITITAKSSNGTNMASYKAPPAAP